MRFGIFYEHQLPRPWEEGAEARLIGDALEQVELADRVGFDHVWEVEHHFLEEYSHSSAPEVFLAACSQRTQRIRLGFGIQPLPPGYQHPARVAEKAAMLDLVSGGRCELGTGETSSGAELGGFGVERATKREQWEEALDVLTRMFVEEPFAGWDGRFLTMPQRNVVPKPVQRPHPPLWVACSRRETIRLAAEKGILVEVEADAAAPPVRADRHRVLQVLSNLLGNAVAFTPERGRVALRCRSEGERVVFTVSDTGPGIAPEDQPHVFDRYWRSPGSHEGSGLGLAIARGIVEAHGGHIRLESRPGEGTTFRFDLPVAAEASEGEPEGAASAG